MLNIVVPIAGKSYFFDNEKDGFPKPFIEICGKTMLEHFIRNYENVKNKRFVFILKEEDVKCYHLDDAINVLTNNQSKIIILKHETQGMVCSVLMAIDEINLNDSLLIVNMDQIFEYDLNEVISDLSFNDAGVLSFESVHPRWAYVKCDENDFVLEAFEKKPVSKNAIAGFYYFNKAEFFVKSAFDMIKKDVNYEGKYFIASTLNELILQDKKIINISIDKNRYFTFYSHAKINEYERIKNV
ncbi:glycosyltransferase family 2 protein [Campylobacter jejuni]|nr:glycosyltransferase family 2 protein [Campylobacter jejuni]MDV6198240.1 glycosyltransferase family 2 protein [Campylobacter jejuni]